MPRLENAGVVVDRFYQKTGSGTSTFDLCLDCANKYKGSALVSLPLAPYHKNEPAGILEGEVDHPNYDDCDYKCDLCGKLLTNK